MREIKFRAWDFEDKKMWQVISVSEGHWDENKHVLMCDFGENPLMKGTDIRQSFTYELMQYTGLKDKKGIKIYEGDIIHLKHETGYQEWDENKEVVEFSMGAFSCSIYSTPDGGCDCEVIGNIYENPELLEGVAE
ncbi:YopX family protein [Lysinibacillus odysseyi]|nr:YopX family protein [Lysinibacillus odysseyi]